jgi:hypothetical protein
VVPGNDDDRLAVDLAEVVLGESVLLLETERGQVAGADDDVGLEVVDLGDRPLEQVRQEELRAAVQIGDLDDRERVSIRNGRSLGGRQPASQSPSEAKDFLGPGGNAPAFPPSGPVATLVGGDAGNA